ncbi:Putative transposase of IS4/5 family [Streptomyces sp. BvitLS-983]|jgi:transposase|nr:Transposase [Streptomyces albidoflavus]SCD39803.1 Putative transposase of IS4/5 family [Streptomyces sp. BvitLS-983]
MEGRPRVPDRQALCGILFVPHTGVQWEYLPQELGFGSGMTGWRRLAAWNESGVWGALHPVLPDKLRAPKELDRSRAVTGSSHVRTARRGPEAAPARSAAHAPRPHRRPGHPPRGVAERRKPQRHHPATTAAGQGYGRGGHRRPAQTPAGRTPRRPPRRPREVPPPAAAARDPSGHRRTRRRARLRPGRLPLSGRAHHRLAARLPPTANPPGTTRRHPRNLPRTRHLPHHPPPRPTTRQDLYGPRIRLSQRAAGNSQRGRAGRSCPAPLLVSSASDGGQRLVAGGWWSMPTSRPLRLASGGAQRRAPPRDERLSGEAPRRCADRRSQP